jgi:hypothetical protein
MVGFHIGGLICHIIAIKDEELNRKLRFSSSIAYHTWDILKIGHLEYSQG